MSSAVDQLATPLPERGPVVYGCLPAMATGKKPHSLRISSPGAPVEEDETSPKSVTELTVDVERCSTRCPLDTAAPMPQQRSPSMLPNLSTLRLAPAQRPSRSPLSFPDCAERHANFQLLPPHQNVDGLGARLKRQRPHLEDADEKVSREKHPLNRGKRACFHTGLPGKLYDRHDVLTPIIDSMILMHHRMGWLPMSIEHHLPLETAPAFTTASAAGPGNSDAGGSFRRSNTSEADSLYALGYGPQPVAPKAALCQGCDNVDEKCFSFTKDKQHVCGKCGVVSSSLRVSTHREKACTEEDDKTVHADKPYDSRTDKYDHPALSCEELRKQRDREAAGTRVSKKAKAKFGLGFSQEHATREAAKADRERAEMGQRDQSKAQHIQLELDALFTPLEPLDNRVKRYCRMEADRAWREAVRHGSLCEGKTKCQLRIKEKGPAVIADAALSCCIATLLEGEVQLDGVTHAAMMIVANKLGAQQVHKGTSCALRAVRTVVGTLLSHTGIAPIPSCPSPKVPSKLTALGSASPASSASSSNLAALGKPAGAVSPSLAALSGTPFSRVDSHGSDVGEPASRLLQIRDAVAIVHKALGTANSARTRDRTLIAVQDASFRTALDVASENDDDISKLPIEGLAYCLLAAVSQQADSASAARERRGVPATLLASFGAPLPRIDAAIASLGALLPAQSASAAADDGDDLLFH